MTMTADETMITFGEFEGRMVRDVAETPAGLRWLSRLPGRRFARKDYPEIVAAVEIYLRRPATRARLRKALN
jgi:hypothetical protein